MTITVDTVLPIYEQMLDRARIYGPGQGEEVCAKEALAAGVELDVVAYSGRLLRDTYRLSRERFQTKHGFDDWDDVWETLWTVETGYWL
jgi:hypothetical protein